MLCLQLDDNLVKRVLVLGLQNAGKTTILKLLIEPSINNLTGITPTAGFFVTSMERHGITLNIWEGIFCSFVGYRLDNELFQLVALKITSRTGLISSRAQIYSYLLWIPPIFMPCR